MTTTVMVVPGTGQMVRFERDRDGRLLGIEAEGHRYLATEPDGSSTWDGGLARVREARTARGMTRRVATQSSTWVETYEWDDGGLVTHVDGVDIRRDAHGRVVACVPGGADPAPSGHRWHYGYSRWVLTVIDGPAGTRHLTGQQDGRVGRWRQGDGRAAELAYDGAGRRTDVRPLPSSTHHRDAVGRLWAVTDADGTVRATWLWDGFRCLARVDGPLGRPLAAVFSLDASGTPVRVCDRRRPTPLRIPRDAFGEGLLDHPGVPGLYGGAVFGGLVHLPWRCLDARSGAFCAPDPCDGGPADPRRAGWPAAAGPGRGPRLPTEDHPSGPYAVCRHDPVGRADPTGGVSAGLVISDLTWSLQTNLLTFFAMDWTVNLFGSLFSGQIGDFGSSEAFSSSDRLGSFGIRRDGLIGGSRPFTTAHLVWSNASEFEDLSRGRVIDPVAPFEPTLYGTLLVARPPGDNPFLLRGARSRGGVAGGDDVRLWSRAGGPAEPAAPGAVVPTFPSGGFHLAGAPLAIQGRRDCPLLELAPADGVATGSLAVRATLDLPDPDTLPPLGALVLLADGDGDLVLTTVVTSTRDGGRGLVRLENDAPAIGPAGVTLSVIDPAPASSEARPAEPAVANSFSSRGTVATYAPGDLVRLTDSGGGAVTVARVARLEARLPLERPLPAGLTPPLTVFGTSVGPTALHPVRRSADTVEFPAGTGPALGSAALARGGGQSVAVIVIGGGPDTVQVDADLTALAGLNAPVDWFPVTAGGDLGRRDDPPEAEPRLTYVPARPGAAPDGSGSSVVIRVGAGVQAAVRRVTAAPAYDAVVLDRPVTGAGPWQVDRLRTVPGTTDISGLTITAAAQVVVSPANLADGADALMLQRLTGAPPARAGGGPVMAGLTLAGRSATGTIPVADLGPRPTPGEVVLVDPAGPGPDELALVGTVRVTPTFDRDLAVDATDVVVLPLEAQGPAWTATRLADRRIVVDPAARTAAGASVTVEFPRLAVGETVQVDFQVGPDARVGHYRVSAVAGTTLDLEDGPAINPGASDIRVTRLVPTDPRTGGRHLGRDGTRVGASPTRRIAFAAWAPDAFPDGRVVGIVSGGRTTPAVVTAAGQAVEVTLVSAAPLTPGAVQVHVPTVMRSGFAARFLRDGNAVLVTDPLPADLLTGPGETLVVVPFRATDRRADAARLECGSLLVPEGEGTEVDRRQALVDHELTHTLQYAQAGPAWFNFFPMFALELPLELETNTELPNYSPFLAATVTAGTAGRWNVLIPSPQGITFTAGDDLQAVSGGHRAVLEVVTVDGADLVCRMPEPGAPPLGAVQVRRRNVSPGWDAFFNVLHMTTHGGLMNVIAGSTWGGIFWLLAKGGYGIFRAIKGTGDLHPVTIQADGRELVLTSDDGRQAIQTGMRVIVRRDDSSLVRTLTRAGDVLTLDSPVTFRDNIRIAPYDVHDPGARFDWLDYFPATIPDPANTAVLELTPIPGRELTLAPRDRVETSFHGQHRRTNVTSVAGNRVELEEPLPIGQTDPSVRIAKVGERDPMGNADSAAMVEMGMGWMQWLFDPYGQIQLDLRPENKWWDLTARVVRYTLGSQSWSLLPFFGYVWWFRLFGVSGFTEAQAPIEQKASEQSGDLYSPLGRLTGQRSGDGHARRRMVVGDVARYRYWLNDSSASLVTTGQQGAPGVHVVRGDLRLMVHTVNTAADADPNGTAESDVAAVGGPGRALPDWLAQKPVPDPTGLVATVTNPVALVPADLGLVPMSPTMQRCLATYAAFCRPGTHRLTTRNAVVGAAEARDVHNRERQTLFYDVTVDDVEVTIGGVAVADDATVELVLLQEVPVVVTPDGTRRYRVTVTRPDGPRLRITASGALAAQATPSPAAATEPVEVSRLYPFDAASGTYGDGGLDRFGRHLGGDVDVAVRQFRVRVVDTVPLRASADPVAAAAASLAQGATGFVLVPAAVVDPLRLVTVGGVPPGPTAPAVTISRSASPPAAATAFVGTGGAVFEVSFAAAPAVAAPTEVVLAVTVGTPGGATADLTCRFDLTA